MKLGTYTTFDAPTDNEAEALNWLKKEIKAIGGNVKLVMNNHDFGPYPSYEADYPEELYYRMNSRENEDCDCGSCSDCELQVEIDNWHEKANAIETEYYKKFCD